MIENAENQDCLYENTEIDSVEKTKDGFIVYTNCEKKEKTKRF